MKSKGNTQREIFRALHKHGAMTGKGIANAIGGHYPTVANALSLMVASGELVDRYPESGRRGRIYAPGEAGMTLADLETLAELVKAYGLRRVMFASAGASIEEKCSPE